MLWRYYKGKEARVSSEFEINLAEKIIFIIIIIASLVFFFINFIPLFKDFNLHNFLLAIASFIPPFAFSSYLVIKYIVIKKTPMKYRTYDIEIKNDDVKITNYKEKDIDLK